MKEAIKWSLSLPLRFPAVRENLTATSNYNHESPGATDPAPFSPTSSIVMHILEESTFSPSLCTLESQRSLRWWKWQLHSNRAYIILFSLQETKQLCESYELLWLPTSTSLRLRKKNKTKKKQEHWEVSHGLVMSFSPPSLLASCLLPSTVTFIVQKNLPLQSHIHSEMISSTSSMTLL